MVDIREAADIKYVRQRTGMIPVSDPEALAAFSDGPGVFDVDPHCRKLDGFVEKHNLQAEIWSEALLPAMGPGSENRQVYFGTATWRKRKRSSFPSIA